MELWIRSQDKEYLAKVDNIRIKHEYEQKKVNDNYGRTCAYINGKYRCSYIYSDSTWLGEYATKERALEVLDEIQQYLNNNCEFIERKTHTSMGNYIDKIEFYVYEMPEE